MLVIQRLTQDRWKLSAFSIFSLSLSHLGTSIVTRRTIEREPHRPRWRKSQWPLKSRRLLMGFKCRVEKIKWFLQMYKVSFRRSWWGLHFRSSWFPRTFEKTDWNQWRDDDRHSIHSRFLIKIRHQSIKGWSNRYGFTVLHPFLWLRTDPLVLRVAQILRYVQRGTKTAELSPFPILLKVGLPKCGPEGLQQTNVWRAHGQERRNSSILVGQRQKRRADESATHVTGSHRSGIFSSTTAVVFLLPPVHMHFFLSSSMVANTATSRTVIHSVFSPLLKQLDVWTLVRTSFDLCFHHEWDGGQIGETCSTTNAIGKRSTPSSSTCRSNRHSYRTTSWKNMAVCRRRKWPSRKFTFVVSLQLGTSCRSSQSLAQSIPIDVFSAYFLLSLRYLVALDEKSFLSSTSEECRISQSSSHSLEQHTWVMSDDVIDERIVFFPHRTIFFGIFSSNLWFHRRVIVPAPREGWLRHCCCTELVSPHTPAASTYHRKNQSSLVTVDLPWNAIPTGFLIDRRSIGQWIYWSPTGHARRFPTQFVAYRANHRISPLFVFVVRFWCNLWISSAIQTTAGLVLIEQQWMSTSCHLISVLYHVIQDILSHKNLFSAISKSDLVLLLRSRWFMTHLISSVFQRGWNIESLHWHYWFDMERHSSTERISVCLLARGFRLQYFIVVDLEEKVSISNLFRRSIKNCVVMCLFSELFRSLQVSRSLTSSCLFLDSISLGEDRRWADAVPSWTTSRASFQRWSLVSLSSQCCRTNVKSFSWCPG